VHQALSKDQSVNYKLLVSFCFIILIIACFNSVKENYELLSEAQIERPTPTDSFLFQQVKIYLKKRSRARKISRFSSSERLFFVVGLLYNRKRNW